MDMTRVAVIGAGVVGLSTAVCISESIPQCSIDVISDKFTPDTTSDIAAGMLIPHAYPGTPIPLQKHWFQETFDRLFAITNSSEALDAGVYLVSGWLIYRNISQQERPFWADTVLGFRKMTESELKKFPQHVFGQAFTTMKCEGLSYLPWLEKSETVFAVVSGKGLCGVAEPPGVQRLRGRGGQVHTRKVEDLWELYGSYDIVVNCSGLGSRELVGDLQLFPVRGQVLKVQAPWLKHFIRDGDGLTYIYPGAFDVTLGGTRQKDDWNLSPDPQNSREILARCRALEPSLQGAWDIKEKVGLRPSRPGIRLQKEMLVRDGHRLPVVHNYGHGAGGLSVHWGTALQAVQLVKELITTLKISTSKAKL
ncbi:D-aspartate oxidase isoform X1 [Dromiciops gliroides]|uniref:D-aspartate oxidase isoform X1 n=1 Tax=Dromiciops gliroides TaxID=33562 RepID=UPI001CC7F841|nr:D-aspartate oxidase isoform X1 [Dromiciops gliroides]XP_043860336.1 D-aspartate oxidase isoform X1 [Dromiciops gliroides]XP_043860337.1 D-aspartate oxidase isoform X1 [Dromiciops gliroides]